MAARAQRRADALSRERIVEVAVALLDADGETGLTFRRLAGQLHTGAGALYHHVANKDELLSAATDAVLTPAVTAGAAGPEPDAVRAVALAVFDTIDAHPWVGPQLSRAPSQPVALRVFECVGRRVRALGVPGDAWFDAASALLNHILGVAGLNAAHARSVRPGTRRDVFLDTVAGELAGLDPAEYPFTRAIAGQLRGHDDREQFLAGVDLILAGIAELGRRSTA